MQPIEDKVDAAIRVVFCATIGVATVQRIKRRKEKMRFMSCIFCVPYTAKVLYFANAPMKINIKLAGSATNLYFCVVFDEIKGCHPSLSLA